mmetsp:Transcript_978/g.1856  ORF Transcript_978/g.1856 Transcript_978/m.1856 type:complete len:238 (-) Transcript_978:478-1191(-)
MAERQGHCLLQVLHLNGRPPLERSYGARGSGARQVSTDTLGAQTPADLGDDQLEILRHLDGGQQDPSLVDARTKLRLLALDLLAEGLGVLVEREAVEDHLRALGRVLDRRHGHEQPEAIQQLRPQLSLVRVPRGDEDVPRGVLGRDALALDLVVAAGRGVEHHVHEAVLHEVDLVDEQDPAVRFRQEPGLELLVPAQQGLLHVDGAAHLVLGRAERQLHDGRLDEGRVHLLALGGHV